jgi:hypothetical protein
VRHATSRMRIAPLPYRRARIGGAQIPAIETLPSRYSPTSGAREYSPTAGATRRRRFCDVASATKVGPAVTLVAPAPGPGDRYGPTFPLTRLVGNSWIFR